MKKDREQSPSILQVGSGGDLLKRFAPGYLLLGVLLLIAGAGTACSAAEATGPDWLEQLEVSRIGVDGAGHVWTLSASGGRVEVYSSTGQVIRSATDSAFSAGPLDVDLRWGVAALSSDGRQVEVKGFDGKDAGTVTLGSPAASVAWIDGSTVAVGPELSNHTVELWSIATGSMVRAIGEEDAILPVPGAQLARATGLAYDASTQTIHTLNSFTGRYRAFSLEGKMLSEEHVEDPDRETIEKWLTNVDRTARESGKEERPVFWSLALSLDGEGTPWVMQKCEGKKSATLVHLPVGQKTESVTVAVPCCWSSLAIFDDWMVLYTNPRYAGSTCKSIRRLR